MPSNINFSVSSSSATSPLLFKRNSYREHNLKFDICPPFRFAASQVQVQPPVQDTLFQAQSRVPEPKELKDYLVLVGKVIFFPVTILSCLIEKICSYIAFHFGVGATKKIDAQERQALRQLGGNEVFFMTEDKVKLEGMYIHNPRAAVGAKTILICSGSHKSYESYTVPMVDALQKLGHHVMLFNYRGFGKSEGSVSEEGFYLDAEAAYQYLRSVKMKSDSELAVLGYSLGSGPATDLAAHHNIKLILDRYFSSMRDVAYDTGGEIHSIGGPIAKLIFYLGGANFDITKKIRKVQGNIFLARGSRDNTMKPYHHAYLQTALASNARAQFVEAASSHHHYCNTGLWFHPDNIHNIQQREQLSNFLRLS
jgi:hypothetical protein